MFLFRNPSMEDGFLNGATGAPNHLIRWFNRRLETDFGFSWVRFQYENSQTHGQWNMSCRL
ncbi:MAG: hypothetical protein CM15mP96_2380 [Gammaproteobacteria bacterium]|nr:MAG: hypothetical protein CM15mP96_2380 [Gammaproteobacteria bacterium]